MSRVHQASKLASGRTLCGRELAKLRPGARVLAGDVAEADVTCSVCRRHRPWEERTLAETPRARPFLPPCSRCGAAADVHRTPTGKACRVCGRVAAASSEAERELAPIAPSDLQAPDLELGFRASSSPAPGAMDRAIGATRSSDALYRRAVEHIALNDDPATLELGTVKRYPSVALVADVWGVSVDAVARYVLRVRKRA